MGKKSWKNKDLIFLKFLFDPVNSLIDLSKLKNFDSNENDSSKTSSNKSDNGDASAHLDYTSNPIGKNQLLSHLQFYFSRITTSIYIYEN